MLFVCKIKKAKSHVHGTCETMSLPAHATHDLVTLGYLQQTPVQDDD